MALKFADTHCHLDFECFRANLDAVIQAAITLGVERFLVPGTQASNWGYQLDVCRRYPSRLFPALGIHPYFVEQHADCSFQVLSEAYARGRGAYVAIGETGLDGRYPGSFSLQQALFEQHMELAVLHDLPLVLHAVRAHAEVLATLTRYPGARGVVHGFSGSYEVAMAYIEKGFYLGVGGVVVRTNAHKTRRALAGVPSERLLLETDSPDMGLPGENPPNTPSSIPTICQALARLRGEDEAALAARCQANADALFAWRNQKV